LIKTLLRTYEGIFDQAVNINEKFIAKRLQIDPADLFIRLQKLHNYHIIDYQPQKDKPQLYFVTNREKAESLQIDTVRWNKLKEQYKKRVEAFIDYVRSAACRSRMIGNYFGDEVMKNCGVCDNCLNQKKSEISSEEFSIIEKRVLDLLKKSPIPARELSRHMNGVKKEKAWKVIEFLQAERKIFVNPDGMIIINK
jgi:ATP-dependent DNA helicase RecQ